MLKAYAVALVLSTTTPVTTTEDGAKPIDNKQETTQLRGHLKLCKSMGVCHPGHKH